jgi:ribonuclease III
MPLSAEDRVSELTRRLGEPFRDAQLALTALTHKSYANEARDAGTADNERLEFLGDAVIDLAISHRLMERFPDLREGDLSKARAALVNEEGLAMVARELGLGELLLLGRGEELTKGREKASMLANVLEALIGALYLERGMDGVLRLVDRAFAAPLSRLALGPLDQDFKTQLQQLAQGALRAPARYRVVAQEGPDHERTYTVELSIGNHVYGQGTGHSKKDAEQAAARQALPQLLLLTKEEGEVAP